MDIGNTKSLKFPVLPTIDTPRLINASSVFRISLKLDLAYINMVSSWKSKLQKPLNFFGLFPKSSQLDVKATS